MADHIISRFDFETICAGILRLIREPSLMTGLSKHLKPEFFYQHDQTDKVLALRKVIRVLKDMHSSGRKEEITFQSVDSNIGPTTKSEEEGKKILNYYRTWINDDEILKKVNDDGSFEIFLRYLKTIKIVEVGKEFSDKYQAGDIDGAATEMQKTIQEIGTIGAQTYESFDFDEAVRTLKLSSVEEAKERVLYLGCDGIDHAVGGFEKQTLNLFIGATGGGKTMMCHHLVRRCIEQRMHVFWACVEDRPKSFMQKILACLTEIPVNSFKNPKLLRNEDFALIKEKTELLKQYVKVVFPFGQSVEAIQKIADDYDLECRINNKPLPVVNILDYTGHIASRAAGEKNFEKLRNAYAARKDYALKNNKITFDFAQINREGNKRMQEDKLLTHSDLAGAYDLSQVCDNIITLNRDSKDISEFKSRIHVSKCRDGVTGITVRVRTQFNKARYDMQEWEWEGSQPFDISEVKKADVKK